MSQWIVVLPQKCYCRLIFAMPLLCGPIRILFSKCEWLIFRFCKRRTAVFMQILIDENKMRFLWFNLTVIDFYLVKNSHIPARILKSSTIQRKITIKMINVNKNVQLNFQWASGKHAIYFNISSAVFICLSSIFAPYFKEFTDFDLVLFICRYIDGIPQLKRRSKIEFKRQKKCKSVEIYCSRIFESLRYAHFGCFSMLAFSKTNGLYDGKFKQHTHTGTFCATNRSNFISSNL